MVVVDLLFWMIVGHFVADCVLQPDTLARNKNRHLERVYPTMSPWPYWLAAHAFTHGGVVALATGSLWLGLAETVLHAAIDFAKCEKWIGPHVDQWAHLLCKAAYLWVLIA